MRTLSFPFLFIVLNLFHHCWCLNFFSAVKKPFRGNLVCFHCQLLPTKYNISGQGLPFRLEGSKSAPLRLTIAVPIRQGWKWLWVTNTLAYFAMELIFAFKSLITQARNIQRNFLILVGISTRYHGDEMKTKIVCGIKLLKTKMNSTTK
jgi:hypothetical protein